MRAGTAAAKGMSEMDAKKRAKLALAAKAKLRNLHMLVVFSSLIILNVIRNRRESKRAQLTQKAQIFHSPIDPLLPSNIPCDSSYTFSLERNKLDVFQVGYSL